MKAENAALVAAQAQWEQQRQTLLEQLAATEERASQAERERDALRASYTRLQQELELLRRRMVVAQAERQDTQQLELEFEVKLREVEQLAGTLGVGSESDSSESSEQGERGGDEGGRSRGGKGKGRRDLSKAKLPVERIVLEDPGFEALVAEGKASPHGFEKSYRVMYQRGGYRVLEVARVKYRVKDDMSVKTAPVAKELLAGTIFTPSLAADILHKKCGMGLPWYRQERELQFLNLPLRRSIMSRMAKLVGELLGDTVIRAMRADAKANAFCIATDATGLKVLPVPREDGKRQPCKRGHVLVQIADRDHVLFDYLERETSAAIDQLFKGYRGYVQADAKSVFDILYRPGPTDPDDEPPRKEVGCWAHARRKFWEATVGERSELAREALYRIRRIYQIDEAWSDQTSASRTRLRCEHLRPHVEDFLDWCEQHYEQIKVRGWLSAAFGYAHRQREALSRFLDDGRLPLDNNRSERALRNIAIGRKNWLFAGSDEHAEALVHIMSLEASARLHQLDAAGYLRDLIRVLPHWPRDRFLELCPRDWPKTRLRLDPEQLATEIGPLDVPQPLA
ncbi:MAG: IS66 family transposase [Myxococcales bacterium]|nr:IS66 family transposase [Myxococcales bacterium]